MFGDILQPTHLLFILFVALLVLGPKRLPEVGRSLGRGLRDFRNAMSGIETEFSEHTSLMTSPPPAPAPAVHQIAPEIADPATEPIAMVSPAAPQPLPEPTPPLPEPTPPLTEPTPPLTEPHQLAADPISADAVAARIGLASESQPGTLAD